MVGGEVGVEGWGRDHGVGEAARARGSGGLGLKSEVAVALLVGDGRVLLGGRRGLSCSGSMAPRHHLYQAPGVRRPRRGDPCAP